MNEITLYGKLVNGLLKIHGVNFPIQNEDDTITITGDSELLLANGFKEIVYTEPEPQTGYTEDGFTWEETDTQLIQTWKYIKSVDSEMEKGELESRVDNMDDTIAMLTECILEMSSMIYA